MREGAGGGAAEAGVQQALGKGGWVVITLIQVAALSGRARRLLPGGGGQPAGQFAAKPAKPRVCPPPFWRGGAPGTREECGNVQRL